METEWILCAIEALEKFTGKIIAVIYGNDDVEEKRVVASAGKAFTQEEIFLDAALKEKEDSGDENFLGYATELGDT